MSKKKGLGKGLDALLPEWGSLDSGNQGYYLLDPKEISPNPYQPRKTMDQDSLKELADSIKEKGIIQPLIVRQAGNDYELIAGERRLRASLMAELDKVPVIIKDVSPAEVLEMALIENIQREELNPLEEADAYARLRDEFGLTQESLSERLGKKRSTIANYLRLRNLPDLIKKDILDGALAMGHARAILALEKKSDMLELRNQIVKKDLSVRAAERRAANMKNPKERTERIPPVMDVVLKDLTQELTRRLGTKVNIKRRGKKGRIEIEFYSDEELDRLISIFRE